MGNNEINGKYVIDNLKGVLDKTDTLRWHTIISKSRSNYGN